MSKIKIVEEDREKAIYSYDQLNKLYNYFDFEEDERIEFCVVENETLKIYYGNEYDDRKEGIYEVQLKDLKHREDFNKIMELFE